MATVTGFTKERMEAIENAAIVSGEIDGTGHLILTTYGGSNIDAGAVLGSVPDANTSTKGIVELATSDEAIAGTDTERAITPAALSAAIASLITPAALETALNTLLSTKIFPVGSYYHSDLDTDPATVLGFGTWVPVEGRMLIGADETYEAGTVGGSATTTLLEDNLPPHTHDKGSLTNANDGQHVHLIGRDQDGATGLVERVLHSTGITGADELYDNQMTAAGLHSHPISGSTGSTGSGDSFSTISPWRAVYIWRRTA